MTVIKLDKPALVLRTSDSDGRSYHDWRFQWPEAGHVHAPDWTPHEGCGHGLHGLLWGQGDAGYLNFSADSKWQVVEITEYVNTTPHKEGHPDKVKYPEGNVLFTGSRGEATAMVLAAAPNGTTVAALTLTGGDDSTLTGGDDGTTVAALTLTGGDDSTLTGGDDSTLTGGNRSTLTGGNRSTLTGGDDSTLTGGYGSTLTGGNRSTLTGGYGSTLTGGYGSTLTGGNRSTLTGGYGSTLTGGYGSTLLFKWYDYSAGRHRPVLKEIGLEGEPSELSAAQAYRCTEGGVIVPVGGLLHG
jgi:hypothetical protein